MTDFPLLLLGVTGERSPAIQYRNLLHLLLKAEKLRGADLLKSKFPSCFKTEGFLKAIVGLEKKGRNSIIFWGLRLG